MAQAKSIKFGKQFLALGDGATAEQFGAICGIENLTLTLNVESNNTNLPDCDDPDATGWNTTDIQSMQLTVGGSGVLDTDAMQEWQEWWLSDGGAERNVRFIRSFASGAGGGYFQGPAVLTAYEEQGQRGQRWQQSFTVAFNGKPTWTPAV